MTAAWAAFLAATIRTATPLALAALGELLAERAGIINIGLEGAIIAGAFAALAAGTHGIAAGFAASALAGAAVALVAALFVVRLRADQIITGTAVTLLGLGLTGALYRAVYGTTGAALSLATAEPLALPALARIPVVGAALFVQPAVTYLVYALVPTLWWGLYRTRYGLALRATGERPDAVAATGISPARVRVLALLAGGTLGGVSGGTLVLAQAGTFAEGMSAGRGFIAIAIVVLGQWHPVGVALGALLFGAASALQFFFQAMGWAAPYQLFLALPYALTLVALARVGRRAAAPEGLGR